MTNLILAGVLGAVMAIVVCRLLNGLKFVSTKPSQEAVDGLANAKALLCTHYCNRISRQLHDGISQDMSLMKLNLHLFHQDHQAMHLQQMQELLEKGIVELRRISRKMQPEEITGAGILHALELELRYIRKNFQVCCTIDDAEGLLQKARSSNLILYSLLEEMLLNAAIHAKATHIQVVAETLNNQQRFLVRDNGIGFNIQQVKTGIGLKYVKEQANNIGATLNMNSTLGKGTCIELVV
jgi:signal transduction histidine kinase